MSHKRRTPCCDIEAHRYLDNIEGDHDTIIRQAAIGAAVERLPDDFAWKVDYMPPPNEVAFFVYCYNRYGTGPTLPEAIAAALGPEAPTDE